MHDMMLVFSKKSGAIIWTTPWRNWPRMIPGDITLMVHRLPMMIPVVMQHLVGTFGVAVSRAMDGFEPADLTKENLDDLWLKRKKCELCWTFLLYVQGMREKGTVDQEARILIDRWYNEIWMSPDIGALENTRLSLGYLPGFYPISS